MRGELTGVEDKRALNLRSKGRNEGVGLRPFAGKRSTSRGDDPSEP